MAENSAANDVKPAFNLESIIASTPSCLKILKRDGSLVHMNKQGLSLIQADSLESVLGANVYDLVEESHLENFKQMNERVCSGESMHLVFEMVGLKGARCWMETYAAPYDIPGEGAGLIAITNDITQQKLKDDVRNLISKIRREYISNSSDPKIFFDFILSEVISITNSEYGFVGEIRESDSGKFLKTFAITDISWNDDTRKFYADNAPNGLEFRNLETLFGEVIKTGSLLITNSPKDHPKAHGIPEGHPCLDAFFGVPLYSSGNFIAMVGIANRPDGYSEQLSQTLAPLFEAIGEMIAHFQLETANRGKEEELSELNTYLGLALEGTKLGIWDWYLADNSVKFDRRWAEMLGLDPSTIKMELATWESRVHPDDLEHCYADIKAYMDGNTSHYRNIHRMKHANGEWIYILDQGKYSGWDELGNPTRFTGTHLEVTEQKRQEIEILEARNKALLAERASSQFLANMSHEIRTPMNGVLGMVDLLADTPLSSDQLEMVKIIRSCGQNLMSLLDDVLDLSKIDAGKMVLERSKFDLVALFTETIELFRPEASEKGVTVSFDLTLDHRYYLGDQTRIRQILSNLLSNANKFTSHGSIKIVLEEKTESDSNWIIFSVEDSGIGIPEKLHSKLFNEFEQADGTTTRKFGGTGLGLAICKHLASMLGGDIKLESSVEVGSIFTVTIPLTKVAGEELTENTNLMKNEELSQSLTILIVEDNSVNQHVGVKILEKLGHIAVVAENGIRAIEVLQARGPESFDIILMDMQMPEMDGIEATKILVKTYGESCPKIIALTANALIEDERRCLEAGMAGYISKPINVQKLRDGLAECWANKI